MGVAALKIKVLPKDPKADLKKLQTKIEVSLKKAGAVKINSVEIEEIAFGLKALIVTLAWPEALATEKAEEAVKIAGVSSTEILDYRRAFG